MTSRPDRVLELVVFELRDGVSSGSLAPSARCRPIDMETTLMLHGELAIPRVVLGAGSVAA